jgi:four helix bundle protein
LPRVTPGNTGRNSRQSLFIALVSLAELETQLIIAGKLGFLEEDNLDQFLAKMDSIGKMTRVLIKRLQTK